MNDPTYCPYWIGEGNCPKCGKSGLPTRDEMRTILDVTTHAQACLSVLEAYAEGRLVDDTLQRCEHQWLPWLTLPNTSSWTKCVNCEKEYQYDH